MRVAVRFAATRAVAATNTVTAVATAGIAPVAAACPAVALALPLLAFIAGVGVADVQPPIKPDAGALHTHGTQQIAVAVQRKVFESTTHQHEGLRH